MVVKRKNKKSPEKPGHKFYQNQVIEMNTVNAVTAAEIMSVTVFVLASLFTPLIRENARAKILKNATAGSVSINP